MKNFITFLQSFILTNFKQNVTVSTAALDNDRLSLIHECMMTPEETGCMKFMFKVVYIKIRAAVYEGRLYVQIDYSYEHSQGGENGYIVRFQFDESGNEIYNTK